MRRALQREIVGLGRPRGEDDLARVGADQSGDIFARPLDRGGGLLAVNVALAVRIAELFGEVRQHCVEHARVERRRRLVVEIDRPAVCAPGCGSGQGGGVDHVVHAATHAAARSARPVARRASAIQASRKWSISESVVVQPRLIRIVEPAMRGGRPIALSTWLGPTLPDEQAAPALTITPSRSSAMICVSEATPGSASAVVLGRRGAAAPITSASGTAFSAAVSRRSRNRRTWPYSAKPARAESAAAAKPAMPGRFSVPARRPRSCPPPRSSGFGSPPPRAPPTLPATTH